jgi:tRNA wybutosine-synthesizing protein 3
MICIFFFQHTCALESGFRNSGITLGKHGKIILAVRSCIGLEVPLTEDGIMLVSNKVCISTYDGCVTLLGMT